MREKTESTDLTSYIGWLLDVSIENDNAILSITTEEEFK
jgi:hypothetical protein